VKVNELEFNAQFVSRMIPKLEWSALIQAAEWVSENALYNFNYNSLRRVIFFSQLYGKYCLESMRFLSVHDICVPLHH